MAYYENESLIGTKNGSNVVFTSANNALEIDSVILNHTELSGYEFDGVNQITLDVAPESTDTLTISYWTSDSEIGNGDPYETPNKLENIVWSVRNMLGEQYSEEWMNKAIVNWLNEAINKICTRGDFPFMEAEATIYLKADQNTYQLPAGFKKIIKVLGTSEEYTHFRNREDFSKVSYYPYSGYSLFNKTLIIDGSSVTPKQLKIRYYQYIPYYDESDMASTSKIPRQYEDALIDYAVMRGKQQEELYDVAREHKELFEERFQEMIVDLTRRVDNSSPSIKANINLF